MLWTFLQSFSFIPLTAIEEMIFEYLFANLSFRLPWYQSNSEVWTKFISLVEDYSRNISVKLLSKYLQWDSSKGLLWHFPLQVNGNFLSCHCNERTRATAIKNIIFIEANVMKTFLQSFWSEYFFANLSFRLPWQPIKFSSLDKIHMLHIRLLKEHFCKTSVKISTVR